MKAIYKIDSQKRLIRATYQGSIDLHELQKCISHLLAQADFREDFNGVSDFRGANLSMDFFDFQQFREWLGKQEKASRGRWAVLVCRENDYQTVELWERMSIGYHESLRVFMDEEKANTLLNDYGSTLVLFMIPP